MDHTVEILLYSRRDTAKALGLSIRSIDYLITTGRLRTRKVGGKVLIPAGAVRQFAREDHLELVRVTTVSPSGGFKDEVQRVLIYLDYARIGRS